jgi:hypothetical protein
MTTSTGFVRSEIPSSRRLRMFVSSNLGVQLDSAAAVDVSDDQRPIASQQSLLNDRCFGTIRCPLNFSTFAFAAHPKRTSFQQ